MPKTNKERLQDNNTALLRIKGKAEDLPPAGGGSEPNIFVQEAEPDVKKGIWLKTNKTVEHYTYDDEVYIAGEWEPDGIHTDIPYPYGGGGIGCVGTDIYLFGGANSSYYNYAYKYDTLTNTWTRLPDIPYSYTTSSAVRSAIIGTDIYLFGGNGVDSAKTKIAYKYDTLTNTYTRLSDIPMEFVEGTVTAVGTDIYLISGTYAFNDYSKQVYKYNTLTDAYTRLNDFPITTYGLIGASSEVIGTDIYLFGSSYSDYSTIAYRYDTTRDMYTALSNIPYPFRHGSTARIGTDIYLFGSSQSDYDKYVYKYDTISGTYTRLTDMSYTASYSRAVTIGTNIYVFKYPKVQVYALQSKTYQQDNLVVVEQGKYKGAGYSIELYNNPKDVDSPKYQFVDAWFHTLQDGLITDIPSYYGDGTQWINFKNPPTNNENEE